MIDNTEDRIFERLEEIRVQINDAERSTDALLAMARLSLVESVDPEN